MEELLNSFKNITISGETSDTLIDDLCGKVSKLVLDEKITENDLQELHQNLESLNIDVNIKSKIRKKLENIFVIMLNKKRCYLANPIYSPRYVY